MTVQVNKLFAPNQLPIIGARLIDGAVSTFEHRYSGDKFDRNSIYIFPAGFSEKVLKIAGDIILVDSDGNDWGANDVEYYTFCEK